VSAIFTLRHRNRVFYKYACSDAAYHRAGAMQFVIWNAIRQAKNEGATAFDLGRTDVADTGLIAFKDRWGARRSSTTYLRSLGPARAPRVLSSIRSRWGHALMKYVSAYSPDHVLRAAGALVYRHVG
jgi:hypothetical protein